MSTRLGELRGGRIDSSDARILEHIIRFWLVEHHPLGTFFPHMIATFD